jgi:hypothetical protein
MSNFRTLSLLKARITGRSVKDIFSSIYERKSWGDHGTVSGGGSDLVQTAVIRAEIAKLVGELRVRTMFDAPCGDYYWMKEMSLELDCYIGGDIVPELITSNQSKYSNSKTTFAVVDIIKDDLPKVDLILCRDCLVHLPLRAGISALKNFARSGSKYLLSTTYPGAITKNSPLLITGNWRPIDLQLPPFSLPSPLRVINEGCTLKGDLKEKSLGLWKLPTARL